MIDDKIIERTANTLNVTVDALKAKTDAVLAEQGAAWTNAGKSETDAYALALKVAGSKIRNDNMRLSRSGASKIEGMFISVPRPKEWGKILYNKMKGQLMNATEEVRQTFVDRGDVVLFTHEEDGTYTRYAAEKYFGTETDTVTELPRHTMMLDGTTHFYCVWDKNNATFPSGDRNFKYGTARPQDERERKSLFLGRVAGSNDEPSLITVTAQMKGADTQFPTFTPGTMAVRMGRDGTKGYLKNDMLDYTADPEVANIFDKPPVLGGGGGLIEDLLGSENILPSLENLRSYYDEFNGKEGWWDRQLAVVAEVIHIDPRDNGAYTLVCADLDVASTAPVVEVWVNEDVDFAVGSKILLVGQTWRTRDTDEQRLSVNGWWVFDEVEALAPSTQATLDGDGWD